MYIEKIHIDTFGKLSDRDFELADGVNIIEGANESGKSTLAAFIKFIFYGVPSREREKLLSWQTGGAAGSITLCDGERHYRIERALVANREAVQLVDADTNMPMRHALDGTTPGEFFFGVGADMFAATAFVSQLGGTAPGGAKVSEGIENILFSADESVNTQRAISKLDAVRVSLLHKNEKGGRLYELEHECAEMELRLSEAKRGHDEILAKEAQLADIKEKYTAAKEKTENISSLVEQFEARRISEMFSRKRMVEGRLNEIRAYVEKETGADVASISRLESAINNISQLDGEVKRTAKEEAGLPPIEADTALDEYVANGGKTALSEQKQLYATRARAYTAVGIIALLIGLVLAMVGVMPVLIGNSPMLAPLISGVVFMALALTLFILGSRSRAVAKDIDAKYDFAELEKRLDARTRAVDAAKLAALASETAQRRYEDACNEARREYGCEPDGLAAILEKQQEKLKSIEKLKIEYDKYDSVLCEIKKQLEPYDESEILASIDEDADVSAIDAEKLPEMRREAEFSGKMAASLEKHITELEKTLAGLYPTTEEPTSVADRLSAIKAERETLTKRHAAYKLAVEKLSEASDSLRESISPRLARDTALLMAHLTGGKYKTFGVGTELSLCAETENGTKDITALSAGTQDAAYLCLRMALISLLYRKTTPPVIYDEAFSRQDDARLLNMMKIVNLKDSQSIIFTSNTREATAMQSVGAFRLIRM